MKKIVRSMIMVAALAFAAIPAKADDFTQGWKWYAGGGIGMFSLDSGVGSDTVLGGLPCWVPM